MTKNEARIAAYKRLGVEWKAVSKAPARRRSPSPARRRSSSPKRKASPRRLSAWQVFFKENYETYSAAAVERGLTKVDAKKAATTQLSEEWAAKKTCAAGAAAPESHHRTGEEPDTYPEYLKKYYKRVLATVRADAPTLSTMDASKEAKQKISDQWKAWRTACRRGGSQP